MSNWRLRPLRIERRPTPLCTHARYIPLDALLAKAWMYDRYGADYYRLPMLTRGASADELVWPDLPLALRGQGEQRYWAASWVKVERVATGYFYSAWVRSFPHFEASRRLSEQRTIVTSKGPYKLYHTPIHAVIIPSLVWYAVGDKEEVFRLLETYIHAVGKKIAHGWGWLKQIGDGYDDDPHWLVEEVEHDHSEYDADGHLMRGLPVERVADGGVAHWYAIRPPYYVEVNKQELVLP